jgi:hypothetical protein
LVSTVSALTATTALAGQSATPPSGYGTAQAQDLSDLFLPGVIPTSIPTVSVSQSGFSLNRRTNKYAQTVTVTNLLTAATANPVYIEVGHLTAGATLSDSLGTASDGNPYILGSPAGLAPGTSVTVTLQFTATGGLSDVVGATTNGTP